MYICSADRLFFCPKQLKKTHALMATSNNLSLHYLNRINFYAFFLVWLHAKGLEVRLDDFAISYKL